MVERFENSRYKPCLTLHDAHIPYVVWFEDALEYYGVPTAVFDLHLLVQDFDQATEALESSGWVLDNLSPGKRARINTSTVHRRFSPCRRRATDGSKVDGQTPTILVAPVRDQVILLLAQDWHLNLDQDDAICLVHSVHLPALSTFVDCLLRTLLEEVSDGTKLTSHIKCHIAYLYEYNEIVKGAGFADQLSYEHRQFHLDRIAGLPVLTRPGTRHEKQIRKALLDGSWTLREFSTTEAELMKDVPPKPRLPSPASTEYTGS